MKKVLYTIFCLMVFAGISGCISPGPLGVESLRDVKETEKLVFGKIVTSESRERNTGISNLYLKTSKSDEVVLYPVSKGEIYLALLPGKYVFTGWSIPTGHYGRIWWKLDVPSGEEGGVYIGDIIISMDTRDVTVSVEDNELSGREILKQRFPDFKGRFTKSLLYRDGV